MQGTLVGLLVFGGIGLVVCGTLYGCQMADGRYYAAERGCVEAGGSFVPTAGYNAACVGQIRRSAP